MDNFHLRPPSPPKPKLFEHQIIVVCALTNIDSGGEGVGLCLMRESSCSPYLFVAVKNSQPFLSMIVGYELLLSEMQKNWGVTDFVSEIQYLQGHLIIEKSVFLTRYGSNVRMSKNISNESLEQNFLCQFLYEWVY